MPYNFLTQCSNNNDLYEKYTCIYGSGIVEIDAKIYNIYLKSSKTTFLKIFFLLFLCHNEA